MLIFIILIKTIIISNIYYMSIWLFHIFLAFEIIKSQDIISSFIESVMFKGIVKKIYNLLNSKYYFDVVYNNYVISKGFNIGYTISTLFDRGIIELVGPKGLSNTIFNLAKDLSKLDTGLITTYALYITIGLLFFLSVILASFILEGNVNEVIKLSIILIFSMFLSFPLQSSSQSKIKLNNNFK